MSREYNFYVYIMFNKKNGTLYIGVTNDIYRRINEHKTHYNDESFSSEYETDKLGYLELFSHIDNAIAREKQIKAGSRAKKIALIEKLNPDWLDLTDNLRQLLG